MYRSFFKRILDILFSSIVIILIAPLLLIVSIMIIIIDGFPVLFLQERIGKNGKPFTLIKFRSMSVESNKYNNQFSPDQRHRVTTLGLFLRKFKIDELPQFINVLKGDISVVGPRPEVRVWVEKFSNKFDKINSIRPGITDYASIKYRNEELILGEAEDPIKKYNDSILPEKMAINIEYVDNHSFFLDLRIIFSTIFSVLGIKK